MKYYHYLKACEEQRSQGVADVTSWIDCICTILLQKDGKMKGNYLFVRCNEVDDNLNNIPYKVSFYLCFFSKHKYEVRAYHEKVDHDQPLYADIRDAKLTKVFLFSSVPDKLKKYLENKYRAKNCQVLNLDDLSLKNQDFQKKNFFWKQSIGPYFNRKILFSLALVSALVFAIAGMRSRCSKIEDVTQQSNFPEIEGTYYLRKANSKEGQAAEIIPNPNEQKQYFLYLYSEYTTPQFDISYDQNTGIISSDELGEGKVIINNESNTIIIQFREWTLSK